MRRYFQAFVAVGLAIAVSGCAGYHTVPPSDYSLASPPVERLAFDQAGDPYAQSNNSAGLAIPPQPPNKNRAFTLRAYYQDRSVPYDREALLDQSVSRIVAGMRATKAKRLVFLIKGFNNSYDEFETQYAWMRDDVIGMRPPEDLYFVQIYWDAIFKGPRTLPAPVAYFADSLTYSNNAGACGLRDVLRRLPVSTDVTFLTHSRGVAVALSAISDSKYDKGIANECQSSEADHALPNQLGDVRLVAFAPAIGDGHMRVSKYVAETKMFDRLDRFYVGYNPNDPAVTKNYFGINLPDRWGGDTRLGGDEGYVQLIDELLAKSNLSEAFQYERFYRKSHDWLEYVAVLKQADCLLWAGKLISKSPTGCKVSQ